MELVTTAKLNGREYLVLFCEKLIYLKEGEDISYNEEAFTKLNDSLEKDTLNQLNKREIKNFIDNIKQKGAELFSQKDLWAKCIFDVEPIEKNRYKVYLQKSGFSVLIVILFRLNDEELDFLSSITKEHFSLSDFVKGERGDRQWPLEKPPKKDYH